MSVATDTEHIKGLIEPEVSLHSCAFRIAGCLYPDDLNAAIGWINRPRSCWRGLSIMDLLFSGRSDEVITFLSEVKLGEPGAEPAYKTVSMA